jgi:hypothetical protein
MINTSQTTTYNLSLTEYEFNTLHELLDETIDEISENLDGTDLTLNDYELYHILQQFNRITGGK